MNILTHTVSGLAVGALVASFSKMNLSDRLKIVFVSGFAGALPDIDSISLWSHFDATIGKSFYLTHSGKEIYSAKFWYSHHAFYHSLFAAVLLAITAGFFNYLITGNFKKYSFFTFFKKNKLFFTGFVLGYLIHLLEDMPTPASTWGGVNLFWPFKTYIGGAGKIWWWNNYDIFLIAGGTFLLLFSLLIINKFVRFNLRKISLTIFALGFVWVLVQINTRKFDFSYTGYAKHYGAYEKKSKELQKEILGDRLYRWMLAFDNKLKLNF